MLSKLITTSCAPPAFNNFLPPWTMDDNCVELVECMGVASGCGEQEAGVANGSG